MSESEGTAWRDSNSNSCDDADKEVASRLGRPLRSGSDLIHRRPWRESARSKRRRGTQSAVAAQNTERAALLSGVASKPRALRQRLRHRAFCKRARDECPGSVSIRVYAEPGF